MISVGCLWAGSSRLRSVTLLVWVLFSALFIPPFCGSWEWYNILNIQDPNVKVPMVAATYSNLLSLKIMLLTKFLVMYTKNGCVWWAGVLFMWDHYLVVAAAGSILSWNSSGDGCHDVKAVDQYSVAQFRLTCLGVGLVLSWEQSWCSFIHPRHVSCKIPLEDDTRVKYWLRRRWKV